MKKKQIVCAFIICILFWGCEHGKIQDDKNAQPKSAPKPVSIIVVGIDESGSYKLWNQVKKLIMRMILQLEPGDIFYIRRITDASYLDNCTIFRLEIPKIKESDNANPFDRKAKIRRASVIHQINSLKKEACQRLADLKFTNSRRTDVHGFLVASGDRFNLAPKDFQRILLIASDLKDNVRYKANYDLTGAHVAVIGFQSSKSPAETKKHKAHWIKKLTNAGASKVIFLSVEEKFSVKFFKEK